MGFLRELSTATQRVANAYRDAALTRGEREFAVSIMLHPLERETSSRLLDQLVKNERIGEMTRTQSDALAEHRVCTFDFTVVNLNSTSAAITQSFEAVRAALHDTELAGLVTDIKIEASERG